MFHIRMMSVCSFVYVPPLPREWSYIHRGADRHHANGKGVERAVGSDTTFAHDAFRMVHLMFTLSLQFQRLR